MRPADRSVSRQICFVALLLSLVTFGAEDGARAQEGIDARFLHVLIVADTQDPLLGEWLRQEHDFLIDVLRETVPAHRMRISTITGSDVRAATLMDYYRSLNVQPNDSIFCFFAGHGALGKTGHVLQMADNSIVARADLLRAMLAKQARLTVLLTDSCANVVELHEPAGEPPFAERALVPTEVARYLFFRHQGIVDVNAASPGQIGLCLPGGGIFGTSFSRALLQPNIVLDSNRDGIVSWHEALLYCEKQVREYFVAARSAAFQSPGKFDPDLVKVFRTQRSQDIWKIRIAEPYPSPIERDPRWVLGINVFDYDGRGGLIRQVFANTPAEWYGIQRGEILKAIDGKPVRGKEDFRRIMDSIQGPTSLRLRIYNPSTGREREISVRIHGRG